MKAITHISLTLENMETINLTMEDIADLDVMNITEQIAHIGSEAYQFQSFDALVMVLKSSTNHTYNSFGSPSTKTIFQRLLAEDEPIGCVEMEYSDGSITQMYVSDEMLQNFEVDEYGNLKIMIGYADDDDDGCICCGDCEE